MAENNFALFIGMISSLAKNIPVVQVCLGYRVFLIGSIFWSAGMHYVGLNLWEFARLIT